MSLKKRVLKDTLQYTAANYLAMAIGIPLSIIMKAILGPAGSGQWALIKVFGSYGEYSDLGTRNAMIREIPQAVGAGDEIRQDKIRDAAFSFTFLASFFSAAVIFAVSFFAGGGPVIRQGMRVLAFLVATTQFYNFSLTLLRTGKKVGALSVIIVLNMILVAVFSVAGALWKGVPGLVAGTFLATVFSVLSARRFGHLKFRFDWDWTEIRRLLWIGFPMVIVSYALVTFLSIDSVLIAKMLGARELGYYTIGLMSIQQISALGRFSQIILIPHIQERYGQTGVLGETAPFFVRTTHALGYFLPLVIGLVFFFVPVAVHYCLRNFESGVPAMKILVLGYFFVAVNEMSSTVLFTANKQKDLIPILGAVILAAAGLIVFFIRAGRGIEGVALASSVAYFLLFLCTFCYAFWHLIGAAKVFRMAAEIGLVFVYFAGAALVVDRAVHWGPFWAEALLKYVLFVLLIVPVLWRLEKKEKIFALLSRLAGFGRLKEAVG